MKARRAILTIAVVVAAFGSLSACSQDALTGTATITGVITIPGDVELTEDTVIDVAVYSLDDEENVASTITLPDGTYSISQLPPGDYSIYVSAFDADVAPQWWGGSTRAEDADVVHLAAGERRTDMDVSLVRGASLSGSISMPGGPDVPVRHTEVIVWDADERDYVGYSEVSEDGGYAVNGLAAGAYKVQVTPARGTAARQWLGAASDWTGARVISVDTSEKLTGLDATLTTGGSISGDVRGAAAREYGASVYATLLASDGEWEEANWVETAEDGTYTISGLAPGRYAVMFSRPTRDQPWVDADAALMPQSSEGEPSSIKYWTDRADMDSADLVTVREGSTVTGISVDLDVGPIADP